MADVDDIEPVEDYEEENDEEVEDEDDEPEDVEIEEADVDDPIDGDEENDIIESDEESQIVEENTDSEQETNNKIKNIYDSEEKESDISSDEESSDEEIEDKFNIYDKKEYIKTNHTQEIKDTYNDINVLSIVERDQNNNIIDENHKTVPILTKYEKTRILGTRICQLNNGSKPYINIENTVIIDNNIIAEKELMEKKIPIIIMRPLPDGRKEYWRLSDLEIITY